MSYGKQKYLGIWDWKIKGICTHRPGQNAAEKNENAYVEFIQFFDDRSLGLVMTQARNNGYKALRILCEH